ncbi:MAG: UPF0146 family protein, partial [Halobacteria archaeon]|nr:UPF0146 family protein [Halobacteria archaeon]
MNKTRVADAVARFTAENYSGKVVEVGIGSYQEVARKLVSESGIEIVVTDTHEIDTELDFVKDDITAPSIRVYEDANLIYSIRPPYEIHGALENVAREVG